MADLRPAEILLSEAQIQKRVAEMALEIRRDYPDDLHVIAVLKGAFIFLSDLARHIPGHVSLDFMAVSSYAKGTTSSGEGKMVKDLETLKAATFAADFSHTGRPPARGVAPRGSHLVWSPGAQKPLVRALWPKDQLRSDVYWKLVALDRRTSFSSRLTAARRLPPREQVVQDIEVPVAALPGFLEFFHREVGIEPVWVCPLRPRRPDARVRQRP